MEGFQLGSAIGLIFSPILMSHCGIYGPFVIFGLFGFLLDLVWMSATSSAPNRSRQISKDELQYIQGTWIHPLPQNNLKTHKGVPPFKRLLSKLPTWGLIVTNAMHSWGFFVILSFLDANIFQIGNIIFLQTNQTWLHIIFTLMIVIISFGVEIYRVDLKHAAWFSAVLWTMMAITGYFAGVLSDAMLQKGISVTLTRTIMQSIGLSAQE